jgi:uncharacterized protein involved in exopolysaccharide biosynthesis
MPYISDSDFLNSPGSEAGRRKALRYLWFLAAAFLVGAPAAYMVANSLHVTYRAEGSLWIDAPARSSNEGGTATAKARKLESTAWIDLLRSREVLGGGVAAEDLAENLAVKMDSEGNFIQLSLDGSDPTEIVSVLNGVMDRYANLAEKLKKEKVRELQGLLKEQLDTAEAALRQAERDLEEFHVGEVRGASDRSDPPAGGAIEERRLRRSFEVAAELYTELQARYETARIAAATSEPDVRILDRAVVPKRANGDIRILVAAAIFSVFLAAALGGAMVLNQMAGANEPES